MTLALKLLYKISKNRLVPRRLANSLFNYKLAEHQDKEGKKAKRICARLFRFFYEHDEGERHPIQVPSSGYFLAMQVDFRHLHGRT